MNEKELLNSIKTGESQTVEFKKSLGLINEIGTTISAFSNTNNGVILVGISDTKKIIGVSIGKKTLEDLANNIKTHTDNHIFPKISVIEIENKNIIIIDVTLNDEKPVFFKGTAYKRVGKSSHKLSASEIRSIAKNSGEKVYWDEQICKNATFEDIDEEKIKWFLKEAKYGRNFNIKEQTPIKEALERLELLYNKKITNAAILLFGKNPQKYFITAETKCARFKGTKPIEFIDMKIFNGNIINQRDNAVEFVKKHINLHATIVETKRIETWEYPIEAIREAITNAICHKDYNFSSNIQIRIFDDRIEIWGSGTLPEPLKPKDLKIRHKSILRNPLIGKCLFLIKYVEDWGTGTNRIIELCLNHGLPEPIFEELSGSLVVSLRKYKITDEILNELNARQIKAIEYIKINKKITRADYASLLNCSIRTAYNDLQDTVHKKIIQIKGKGKSTYYELA